MLDDAAVLPPVHLEADHVSQGGQDVVEVREGDVAVLERPQRGDPAGAGGQGVQELQQGGEPVAEEQVVLHVAAGVEVRERMASAGLDALLDRDGLVLVHGYSVRIRLPRSSTPSGPGAVLIAAAAALVLVLGLDT